LLFAGGNLEAKSVNRTFDGRGRGPNGLWQAAGTGKDFLRLLRWDLLSSPDVVGPESVFGEMSWYAARSAIDSRGQGSWIGRL
jgi:hypothetical protein